MKRAYSCVLFDLVETLVTEREVAPVRAGSLGARLGVAKSVFAPSGSAGVWTCCRPAVRGATVLAALEALRSRGLGLGVVSNCMAEEIAGWGRSPLAGCFDVTAFSCHAGLAKPHVVAIVDGEAA